MNSGLKHLERIPTTIAAISGYFFLLSVLYYGVYFRLVQSDCLYLLEFSDYANLAVDLLSWQVPLTVLFIGSYLGIVHATMQIRDELDEKLPPLKWIYLPSPKFEGVRPLYTKFLGLIGATKMEVYKFNQEIVNFSRVCLPPILALIISIAILMLENFENYLPVSRNSALIKVLESSKDFNFVFGWTAGIMLSTIAVFFLPLVGAAALSIGRKILALFVGAIVISIISTPLFAVMRAHGIQSGVNTRAVVDLKGDSGELGVQLEERGVPIGYISKGVLLKTDDGRVELVRWESIIRIFTSH